MKKQQRLNRRKPINDARAIQLYQSGLSEKAVAEEMGVGRRAIRLRLLEHGIEPRGRSAAMFLRMAQMTETERKANAQAAHDASRGSAHSDESYRQSALTRQRTQSYGSPVEAELAKTLRDRGLETISQQAIDRYNCDLGADPVAIEVFGGGWHWSGQHLAILPKRTRTLFALGWDILVVWVDKRWPLGNDLADFVNTYVRSRRQRPHAAREYLVVRGDGVVTVAVGSDFVDGETLIPSEVKRPSRTN